ncbi:hypothetical protein F5051DRAFT_390995, partial [Lentinula edodes]
MNILVFWTSSSIILVSAEPPIAFAIYRIHVESNACPMQSASASGHRVLHTLTLWLSIGTALVFWKDMICTSIPISVVRVRLRQDFTKFVVIIIAQLGIPGTIKVLS